MEKRAVFRSALAAVRADRAAARDHDRLLLPAGGAGAVPVAARSRTRSGSPSSSSGSTISASCSPTALPRVVPGHRGVLGAGRGARAVGIARRWRCSPTARLRGADVYKTLLIWPYAVAPAVAAVLWLFLFNPTLGVVAHWLQGLGVALEPAARRQRRADHGRRSRPSGSRSATTSCSSSPACSRSRSR